MTETSISTNKVNHAIDPYLQVWGWEVSLYLFLGGLSAGLLVLSALALLLDREKRFPVLATKLPLFIPCFLNLGMLGLFLDIEFKLHVWRFYTTFQVTSVMSWGSWILLIVEPLSLLLALGTIRAGYPGLHALLQKLLPAALFRGHLRLRATYMDLVCWSEDRLQIWARLAAPFGVALGIYTGILLSTYGARPFWNTAILGPLFLVSGISSALAFSMLISPATGERSSYGRADILLILVELLFIALMLLNMVNSNALQRQAADLVLGGQLTSYFWCYVLGLGMLLPLLLELLECRVHLPRPLVYLPPLLVLVGGFLFRDVIVQAGQLAGYITY